MNTHKFNQQKCRCLQQEKPRKLKLNERPVYGFPCGCTTSIKKLKKSK